MIDAIITGLELVFNTKIGRWALFVVVAAAIAFALVKHFEAEGAAEEKAKQQKFDAAWMTGAIKNMDDVQAKIAPYVAALTKAEKDRAAQRLEIARLAAGNTGACLDLPAVRSLRGLSTEQPAYRGGIK